MNNVESLKFYDRREKGILNKLDIIDAIPHSCSNFEKKMIKFQIFDCVRNNITLVVVCGHIFLFWNKNNDCTLEYIKFILHCYGCRLRVDDGSMRNFKYVMNAASLLPVF